MTGSRELAGVLGSRAFGAYHAVLVTCWDRARHRSERFRRELDGLASWSAEDRAGFLSEYVCRGAGDVDIRAVLRRLVRRVGGPPGADPADVAHRALLGVMRACYCRGRPDFALQELSEAFLGAATEWALAQEAGVDQASVDEQSVEDTEQASVAEEGEIHEQASVEGDEEREVGGGETADAEEILEQASVGDDEGAVEAVDEQASVGDDEGAVEAVDEQASVGGDEGAVEAVDEQASVGGSETADEGEILEPDSVGGDEEGEAVDKQASVGGSEAADQDPEPYPEPEPEPEDVRTIVIPEASVSTVTASRDITDEIRLLRAECGSEAEDSDTESVLRAVSERRRRRKKGFKRG